MRTKISCSDGRATSKCSIRVRRASSISTRLRIGARSNAQFLQVPVIVHVQNPGQVFHYAVLFFGDANGVFAVFLAWMESSVPSSTFLPRQIMKMVSHISLGHGPCRALKRQHRSCRSYA